MTDDLTAAQTPLRDLLGRVPADARLLYEHGPTNHSSYPVGRLCAEAKAEIERLLEDAARYRWLRERLMAADFDWQDSGQCALVFAWPKDCAVSGNCDSTIDAAMKATP